MTTWHRTSVNLKKRIFLFHQTFFGRSETFIYQHVQCVENFFDIFLGAPEIINEEFFPLQHARLVKINSRESEWGNFIKKVKWKLGNRFVLGLKERKNLKNVFRKHKIQLIHAQFGYNGVRIFPLAKKMRIPLIVSFHGYDASDKIYDQPAYRQRLQGMMNYASQLIVVSDHMPDRLGMTPEQRKKVVFFPYLIDTEYFTPLIKSDRNNDIINILHSGRLTPKKGVPDLVRVFLELSAEYAHIRLHILGEGSDREEIESLLAESPFKERVYLYGSQPHAEVRRQLELADIFVLNSATAPDGDMEGLPVALLEAMSMGKAVISTRHAGIPHALQDGYNGLMTSEKDREGLKAALHRLIMSKDLRMRFGLAARTTIEKDFNLKQGSVRWKELYCSILDKET